MPAQPQGLLIKQSRKCNPGEPGARRLRSAALSGIPRTVVKRVVTGRGASGGPRGSGEAHGIDVHRQREVLG